MKEEDIPPNFVNRQVIARLMKESQHYRTSRTIFMFLALLGWGAFVFLLLKG